MKYRQLIVFVGAGMVGACVDARGAYDDFADRIPDAAVVADIDGGIVSSLPDVDGEFYMVARPDLTEKRLIHIRITLALEPVTENTGLVSFTAHFLDYTTLEVVGAEVTGEDIEIGSDASFDALPLDGTVPAAANSITGSNADMDGLLTGTLVSPDFLCGSATGSAGGYPLDGTEWAAVRITGDTLPDPVWRCEDQPL